ncbi:type I glyceraldehyde-3-phosphate dehydrogenase [Candidatus Mesenet endosymbiont of Agriotes lineatus]|uniref:type I glyceraldehyde-3-phosphate dehydrogenase n=1 Tax=Candidatus Mesenet endosymbiont of Agriotes lineatus TaxID=3077948 RepID=UPI0030D37B37
MAVRLGINGLGRIGNNILRAVYEVEKYSKVKVMAINGSMEEEKHVHLLKYDSVHGKFKYKVAAEQGAIAVEDDRLPFYRERNPKNVPWSKHGADIILECTGAFNKRDEAKKHISSGAKKVIVSAPVTDADVTIIYGVNNDALKSEHEVISAGSCTTNCLAPILQVLHDSIGVSNGFMTTIHAYTNDQNIVDGSHRDLRRARACMLSMIPTTTGAAKTIGLIIPKLQEKLDGVAIRVPVANVSLIDLKFTSERNVTIRELNDIFKNAAKNEKQGILAICEEPLVSVDFVHNSHSAIVDLMGTHVIDSTLCRVAAWYDNEWAFSLRMLDIAILLGQMLK